MKKLLAFKKYDEEYDLQGRHYKDPAHNWNLRNNSWNVAAILHPDNHLTRPKKPQGVLRKYPLMTNNCYCGDIAIKPKLMPKPNTCVSVDVTNLNDDWFKKSFATSPSTQRLISSNQSQVNKARKSGSMSKFGDNNRDKQSFSKDLELKKSVESSYGSTELGRDDVERFRQQQEENLWEEAAEYEKSQRKSFKSFLSSGTSDENSENSSTEGFQNLKEMNDFRNEHYFETHSTEKLTKIVPKHDCLYQFKLDERLLPVPIAPDVFGRSTCAICEKAMDNFGKDPMASKVAYKGDGDDGYEKKCAAKFAKAYQYGLAPRAINIGGPRAKMQVVLSEGEICKFDKFMGRFKRPLYKNSYALRQQKMAL